MDISTDLFTPIGKGIVGLTVDQIMNNLVWIATTKGHILTFNSNYNSVGSKPLTAEGDLTLNSDLFSKDKFRSVILKPFPSLKGLGIFYNHGVYKIRSCGNHLGCASDISNIYFGCEEGWYLSSEPKTCSKCDSSCADCEKLATRCTKCSPKFNLNTLNNSCECKTENHSLTQPGCCDILNGEQFTNHGTCQKCQDGCSKCVSDGKTERCFDELINEISRDLGVKNNCLAFYEENKELCEKNGVLLPVYEYRITPQNSLLITLQLPKNMPEFVISEIKNQENLIDIFKIETNDQNVDIKVNFMKQSRTVTFDVMSSSYIQNFKISIVPKNYHVVPILEIKPSVLPSSAPLEDIITTKSTSARLRMVQSSKESQ